MRAAYSQDLRLHILAMFDGGMSKKAIHQRYGVSRSTFDHWLQRRQDTGGVLAITEYKRGPSPAISDLTAFEQFAQRHSGATLAQMALAWQEQTGQKLSINTFSLTLKRLGWTRKKRVFCTRSVTVTNARSLCVS